MSPMIGQQLSRIAAVIIAAFAGWLASTFGVEVTEEQRAGLEAGVTALGWIVGMLVYGLVRPLVSRWVSPKDSAEKA